MHRPVHVFRNAIGLGIVVLAMALAFVSNPATRIGAEGTPAVTAPFASEFAAARGNATSGFEQDVLADDVISQSEYEDAANRFVSCLRDEPHGFDVTAGPDPLIPGPMIYRGEIAITVPPEVRMQIIASCQKGTTALVEPLFIATIVNPEHVDFDALVLTCLHQGALVEAAFGANDLPTLRDDERSATARINPTAIHSPLDGAVVTCLANPLGIGLNATPKASPDA